MNTTKRYVGVLYNLRITTAVWVANKNVPLNDTFGKVTIFDDGNLVVLDGLETIIWSTNLSNPKINSTAQLLDSGNLVLRDNSNGAILWESFENPCDSYLPNMRLSQKTQLISWKTPSDPSTGRFSVGLGSLNTPELFLWNGGQPFWRSGPWDGQIFTGIPDMNSAYNNGFHLVNDNDGNMSLAYNFANDAIISYFVLDSNGSLIQKHWNGGKQDWEVMSSSLENDCNVYGKCGPFGICKRQDTQICSFYHDEVNLSLLGFVSNLWSEKKTEELTDPRISESCSQKDILRYAHVRLLCVQDLAKDRPSVPLALSMLSSEIVDLPTPKQPIFTQCQMSSGTDSLQSQHPLSVNDLTFITLKGR